MIRLNDFFIEIMTRMGFEGKWIDKIMRCISSILINGMAGECFRPSREVRQDDPLSPFLFLIYSEGLSSLMFLAMLQGLIHGAKANRSGP